jgi:hypothetical protein
MARCDICQNESDHCFVLLVGGRPETYDSLECAVHALTLTCDSCSWRIAGPGIERDGFFFCSPYCAKQEDILGFAATA